MGKDYDTISNLSLSQAVKQIAEMPSNTAKKAIEAIADREGWTQILNLVQYAINIENLSHKTAFEWEKEFAESFSAEPGREWVGYDEYLLNMEIYCNSTKGTDESN